MSTSSCASTSHAARRSWATTEDQARKRLGHLLTKIASAEPAPASGSAAAAVAAAAAALVQKVAKLSGKQWADAADVHARAESLRLRSEELIEEDSMAYLAFVAAVRSGKDVAGAQSRTVEIPLEIVKAAAEVSSLAVQSASLGNPRLRADAVVAAMLSAAAAESAAFLVAVNVGDGEDERLDEARMLASESSARLQSPAVRGSEGGRDHGPARS